MAVWASVEYVSVNVTATAEPVTTNLTKGQDETQCTPFWTERTTGNIHDRHGDRTHEITFIDNSGTAAVVVSASARTDEDTTVIQIFVVEWDASITVEQKTVSTFADTDTSETVTINDVTTQSTAFFHYSYQYTDVPASQDDLNDIMIQARFNGSSTTEVLLTRRAGAGAVNGTLYVVKCGSGEFTVLHGVEIDVTSGTDVTEPATIAATVTADTFLIHSYESSEGGDDMRDAAWDADLENTTTVRVRREGTGANSTSTHSIQVVECQDSEWDVQRKSDLSLSGTTTDHDITAIDQARSVISMLDHSSHTLSAGRNASSDGDAIDGETSAASFLDDDTVRFVKGVTGVVTPVVSFEVIQFAELGGGVTLSERAFPRGDRRGVLRGVA